MFLQTLIVALLVTIVTAISATSHSLATVTPSSTTGLPSPQPAPLTSALPSSSPLTVFENVGLGQTRDQVRAALGNPLKTSSMEGDEVWIYSFDRGNDELIVSFHSDAVRAVGVGVKQGKTSTVSDPFGVTLGDSLARLKSVRGEPTAVTPAGDLRYGAPDGVKWYYTTSDGRVRLIMLERNPVSASLALPSPQATPWINLSIGGVLLGQSASSLRTMFGSPLFEDTSNGLRTLTYHFDDDNVALTAVLSFDAVDAVGINLRRGERSAFADPFGIALGDSVKKLTAIRGEPDSLSSTEAVYTASVGFKWRYTIVKDVVKSILLVSNIPITGPLPDVTVISGRDGFSADRSIRSKAKNIMDAISYEAEYVGLLRCDGQGVWRVKRHSSVMSTSGAGSGMLSVFDVECTTSKRHSSVYFDHTGLPLF